MPRVSVVLTAAQPAEHLRDAIDGVLRQTFGDFELRICAPNPDDALEAIVREASDPRIRIWPGDAAAGAGPDAADLAAQAAGDEVAILRPDEAWEPNRLERQVAYLDAHPDLGAVLTLDLGPQAQELGAAAVESGPDDRARWAWLRRLFLGPCPTGPLGMLVRTPSLREVGGYRSALTQTRDAELLSRLLIRGPVGVIEGGTPPRHAAALRGGSGQDALEMEIRALNEWHVLRENYLSLASFEDVVAIFPSLERFRTPLGWDIKFLLAMACVHESNQRDAWDLGLRWLFELVDEPASRARIQALYGFSAPQLGRLAGELDVYAKDWARLIADWEQHTGSAWDRVIADRDWLIGQRQWLLTERDWLRSQRESLIAEREAFRDQIYRSASGRLTRPVRFLGGVLRGWWGSIAAPKAGPVQAPLEVHAPHSVGRGEQPVPGEGSVDGPARSPATPPEAAQAVAAQTSILLVTHEFSRTGAPYAALYLARALVACCGIRATILSPEEGPLRREFEQEGFVTLIDGSWSGEGDPPPELREWVSRFDRVIVNSLAAFRFIERFRGQARRLTWWIHETAVGFDTVATMTPDLSALFCVCESLWLASPLCFPLAERYAPPEKLHLLLYGCPDRALPHRPHPSGKTVFLLVGSVERRKAQDLFLDAIERLDVELRGRALFHIVGSPLPNNPDSTLFWLRMRSRVTRLPQVRLFGNMPLQRLHALYSEADVIVSASRDDPMPIVVTEGLMHAKVCLCSSAIGQAKLLEDGKDGLIFASESAEDLARKLAWVLQHPAELPAIGRAGRAVFERYFLPSAFADNLGKLLGRRAERAEVRLREAERAYG